MPGPHVNGLFKIRSWSKVHNNDQTVLIFGVKDEQTGLHICAKRIFDRPRRFVIIEQKACRMLNKTVAHSSLACMWLAGSYLRVGRVPLHMLSILHLQGSRVMV
jgi:hypothetical protein